MALVMKPSYLNHQSPRWTLLIFFLMVCSGGMNGYISLCMGDPCPPIFRAPMDGLEDIMDNQVM